MVAITSEEFLEMGEPNPELLRAGKSQIDRMEDISQVHSLQVLTALIWPKILTGKIAIFTRVSMSIIPIRSNIECKAVMDWETRSILIHRMVKWALIRRKSMWGLAAIHQVECSISKVKPALQQAQQNTQKVDKTSGTFKTKWHHQHRLTKT